MDISGLQLFQPPYKLISVDRNDVSFCHCDFPINVRLFLFQLHETGFCGRRDDALLYRRHEIFDTALRVLQLVLQKPDPACAFLMLAILDHAVGNPVDRIIIQCAAFDRLCYLKLDVVPSQVFLLAGFFRATLLADVVVMQVARAAGAGDAGHWTFAVSAEQLAGKQIVTIDAVTPLRILLRGDHLLDLEVKLVADNPRDAALFADIAVDIDAAIPFVGKDLLKARPPPRATVRGLDSPGIQAGHDINESLTAGNASEYLPDNRSLRLVDGIVQRFVRFIAVGQMAVRHHAIRGVVI